MSDHEKEKPGKDGKKKSLMEQVDAVGGWNQYYIVEYTATWAQYQKEVPLLVKQIAELPPLPEGDEYHKVGLLREVLSTIEKIETLFALHVAFCVAGYDSETLFMRLVHTRDYYGSVLVPMLELVNQGKVEEAWELFNQPRRHHR